MLRKFMNDEAGFIVSAELALIFTLVFCAVAVGMSTIKDSLANELNDVAEAIGAIDNSYAVSGIASGTAAQHGSCANFGYNDRGDDCDNSKITITGATATVDDQSTGEDADG